MVRGKGKKLLKVEELLDRKIEDLSIQIIPLWLNTGITFLRNVGKAFQQIIHPAIFVSLVNLKRYLLLLLVYTCIK